MMNKYIIIATVFFGLASCLKEKAEEPSLVDCTEVISYSNQIAPNIIDMSCNTTGCHDSNGSAAGYDLSNYDNVKANADIILKTIKYKSGVSPMPSGSPQLNDSLLIQFECWINQGSLEN